MPSRASACRSPARAQAIRAQDEPPQEAKCNHGDGARNRSQDDEGPVVTAYSPDDKASEIERDRRQRGEPSRPAP